eukprot:sb/3468159/
MVGAEEDRYDNILLCLELLSHLCSRDFFSFDEPDSFEDSSSKLVLIGLDIIVPHIDVELLKFPKLSSEFFKLITFICEVYPEKVTNLPENVVDQIILMLKVGLNNYNDDITFYIFNAVSALAIHSAANGGFQRKIGAIVKDDPSDDPNILKPSAGEYMSVVNEIVTQQENSTSQECLKNAFSTLIPNTPNLSRRDKEQFSKVFENFAINVVFILDLYKRWASPRKKLTKLAYETSYSDYSIHSFKVPGVFGALARVLLVSKLPEGIFCWC